MDDDDDNDLAARKHQAGKHWLRDTPYAAQIHNTNNGIEWNAGWLRRRHSIRPLAIHTHRKNKPNTQF